MTTTLPRSEHEQEEILTSPDVGVVVLNKRIQSISCITNIQELCDLIRSSSAEFNHVKVATALRKGLQETRLGVSPEVQWVSALSLSLSLSLLGLVRA